MPVVSHHAAALGGVRLADLDLKKLREYAEELGYWPATTRPEDIERHRRLNAALDVAPDPEKTSRKFAHLRRRAEREANEAEQRRAVADLYKD